MKDSMMFRMVGSVLDGMIKPKITDKEVRRRILAEYHAVLGRAADIGAKNTLISSYLLAAFFIGMNRCTGLTADENIAILEEGMRTSKALKLFMGDAKGYFSEKHMEQRRQWSKLTHERRYANDWVVDVLEQSDDYRFGLDYTECGVVKLCRDEGCPELAHYLCRLDFMLVELIGIHLERTMTLADGDPKCDFRFKD